MAHPVVKNLGACKDEIVLTLRDAYVSTLNTQVKDSLKKYLSFTL